jgi:hypothetical protein
MVAGRTRGHFITPLIDNEIQYLYDEDAAIGSSGVKKSRRLHVSHCFNGIIRRGGVVNEQENEGSGLDCWFIRRDHS